MAINQNLVNLGSIVLEWFSLADLPSSLSVNQPDSQSTWQSTGQLINLAIHQLGNQSTWQSINLTINRAIHQHGNQSIHQLTSVSLQCPSGSPDRPDLSSPRVQSSSSGSQSPPPAGPAGTRTGEETERSVSVLRFTKTTTTVFPTESYSLITNT